MALNHEKMERSLDLVAAQVLMARKPVVLCSFGKDSVVLLHLCQQTGIKMPVLLFVMEAERFPEKYAHAWAVIQASGIEAWTMPPSWKLHIQRGDYFEIFHGFGSPTMGQILCPLGVRACTNEAVPYVCAVDYLSAPCPPQTDYPWDLTFLGHKSTDANPLVAKSRIVSPVSEAGSTRFCLPLWDWTDEDVWAYIRHFDLPYDVARYEQGEDRTNPDAFPTCFACLDTRARGQMVMCPKVGKTIRNLAQSPGWHEATRRTLLSGVGYLEVEEDAPIAVPPTPARMMAFDEAWPLFSVRKLIAAPHVWLEVYDLVDVSGKADGLKELRHEWERLERACLSAGLIGWCARVDHDNARFRRWILATGARPYEETETGTSYQKVVDRSTTHFPTLREMARTMQEASHA